MSAVAVVALVLWAGGACLIADAFDRAGELDMVAAFGSLLWPISIPVALVLIMIFGDQRP